MFGEKTKKNLKKADMFDENNDTIKQLVTFLVNILKILSKC